MLSISQLAVEFEIHRSTVSKRLANCPGDAIEKGHPVYKVSTAAPHLIEKVERPKPARTEEDVDNYTPRELKEHYQALNEKNKYLKEREVLWETEKVFESIFEVLKPISQFLRTLPDVAERTLGLDSEQTSELQGLSIEVQQDVYDKVIKMQEHVDDLQQSE